MLALVPYVLWLVFAYRYHFIDGVNLAFHEAGHLFLGCFGETLHMLGGTLGQLFFPGACMAHFWRNEQPFEAALCGVWLGENGMNIAVYLADARDQVLPLVGGDTHDWHWLLYGTGWLGSCERLGTALHVVASLVVLASLAAAARLAFKP